METQTEFFLVIDLEATCDDRNARRNLVPKHEMEIIEIGAVLVSATTFEAVGEVGTFVKPVRHPILTPFCTELTTIKQSDVANAPRFPEALAKVASLIQGKRALFCSWGNYDKNQFVQDARFHRVSLPFGNAHLNLKERFSEVRGISKKLGMNGALREAGLKLEGTHHRGIDDARNIARLLPFIFSSNRA